MTHPLPIAGKLSIKTLVARQLLANIHAMAYCVCYLYTSYWHHVFLFRLFVVYCLNWSSCIHTITIKGYCHRPLVECASQVLHYVHVYDFSHMVALIDNNNIITLYYVSYLSYCQIHLNHQQLGKWKITMIELWASVYTRLGDQRYRYCGYARSHTCLGKLSRYLNVGCTGSTCLFTFSHNQKDM